jgi:hypothetical protein
MKPAGGLRRERLGEIRHNMALYVVARAACARLCAYEGKERRGQQVLQVRPCCCRNLLSVIDGKPDVGALDPGDH